MAESERVQPVVVFLRDLMFRSKISASARATGAVVEFVRDATKLPESAGRLLVVDLNEPGAIEAAVAWKAAHGAPAVGFVSHVDTPVIAAARAAGIDRVLARSAFVTQLESVLGP